MYKSTYTCTIIAHQYRVIFISNKQQYSQASLFPIRLLAKKTGVGTSTLRAWERRYGLLQPQRTPKGHRVYSEEDVNRVLKILDLVDDGHSLSGIAEMLATGNLPPSAMSSPLNVASSMEREPSPVWGQFIQATINATNDFNIERIDAIFNEASSLYPLNMVIEQLIQPTLIYLGEAWKKQPEIGIAEEHFYTSWLKNRIGARFHHVYSLAKGARVICACAPGCFHEIGLMLFSLTALSRGYRVLYFGADLPINQFQHVLKRSAARAIILSVQNEIPENSVNDINHLISTISRPVFIGGLNQSLDESIFEKSGGILLGSNTSIALQVLEKHVPAYTSTED